MSLEIFSEAESEWARAVATERISSSCNSLLSGSSSCWSNTRAASLSKDCAPRKATAYSPICLMMCGS
ncbi:hypothetical protein D3C71_1751000 [compost metagenome]